MDLPYNTNSQMVLNNSFIISDKGFVLCDAVMYSYAWSHLYCMEGWQKNILTRHYGILDDVVAVGSYSFSKRKRSCSICRSIDAPGKSKAGPEIIMVAAIQRSSAPPPASVFCTPQALQQHHPCLQTRWIYKYIDSKYLSRYIRMYNKQSHV